MNFLKEKRDIENLIEKSRYRCINNICLLNCANEDFSFQSTAIHNYSSDIFPHIFIEVNLTF